MRASLKSAWMTFTCLILSLWLSAATVDSGVHSEYCPIVDTDQILVINEQMRALVDELVTPLHGNERRVDALMGVMFDADKLALRYEAGRTMTAVQTVERGAGNCLSLANVFVALGRYSGLRVSYLSVSIPESWSLGGSDLFLNRHTTARVRLDSKNFATMEYQWIAPVVPGRHHEISDERAFAEFLLFFHKTKG